MITAADKTVSLIWVPADSAVALVWRRDERFGSQKR